MRARPAQFKFEQTHRRRPGSPLIRRGIAAARSRRLSDMLHFEAGGFPYKQGSVGFLSPGRGPLAIVIGRHALACTLLFVATFLGLRSLAKSTRGGCHEHRTCRLAPLTGMCFGVTLAVACALAACAD